MRLGVLDVGSNTVHLLVVDAYPGALPWAAHSHKAELHLAEHLDRDGRISPAGAAKLRTSVTEALEVSDERGAVDVLAFVTSAVREAPNGQEVIASVEAATGARLEVLTGVDEARLTFLAARRWYGWSSGRLLMLDIGGGSLEIAIGLDEEPDAATSLPLGAGRLTRTSLRGDPPSAKDVKALRKFVRAEIASQVRELSVGGGPDHVVGTSKTFRSLARIAGAAPSTEGMYVRRVLRCADLRTWVPRLAEMTVAQRAALPGVSANRAPQLLAGALVAEAAMDLLGVEELQICPWALREGIILRRLDVLRDAPGSEPAGA